MLQLTKRTEYALIALVHLVHRRGELVSAREIAERYPLPRRLLAEVLKDLQHAGFVHSQLGSAGGYRLARDARELTVAEVVAALEGTPPLTSCAAPRLASDAPCEVEPRCPIRSPLQVIREGIWSLLHATTLRALADAQIDAALAIVSHHSAAPTRT